MVDIAFLCLIYKKDKDGPHIKKCKFDPPFKSNLYFVYLKQKRNSKEAVNQFKKQKINEEQIAHSSKLTQAIVEAQTLNEFEQAINQHELFVGNILGLKNHKIKKDVPAPNSSRPPLLKIPLHSVT